MTGRRPPVRRTRARRSSAGRSPAPDTICAIATPAGTGGIAVVRLSGGRALSVVDRFVPDRRPSRQPTHTVRLNWLADAAGRPVDQVMITVFRAPRSYTGEDVVEIACHGGTVAADAVLRLLTGAGCRIAEPGEFTRRAVLAGKLTLSQAEAVADMAEARTEAGFQGALSRYRGELSNLVAALADDLKELLAELEYRLGFDEHGDAGGALPARRVRSVAARLSRLVDAAASSRFTVDGATIAIIGRPNAGKSSLFNRLVRSERAITSPVAGTTRDRVDAAIMLAGVPVRFVDTAGLTVRAGTHLSRLALAQTGKAIEQADVIVALFDGSRPSGPSDEAVLAAAGGRPAVCVLNKTDLPRRFDASFARRCPSGLVRVSCRTGAGIEALRTRLARLLRAGPGPRLTVNRRQLETLGRCRDAIVRAGTNSTLETAALETRLALDILSQVDAPTTSTDILDRVFARFCVGK
jgi:tRNA modification GTPase